MTDRRKLLYGMVALAAAFATRAQAPPRVYRVGYFGYTAVNTPLDDRVWGSFVQRLRDLGYAEGGNLVIEMRFAEGRLERYTEFAAEMVKLKADIVVVTNGTAARAMMTASRSMPIVTTAIPDPVRSGLVASLARPGGQLTGLLNFSDDLLPKRLELLKAAVPGAQRIALARCPRCLLTAGASQAEVDTLSAERDAAARSMGVKLLQIDVDDAADFDAATAALRRERPDALLIGTNQINVALREKWIAFAVAQRLPLAADYRDFGAMLSYGPDYVAIYRKAAEFVVRILKGARPGDLPMEQPTTFELVINLRVAKALGVTIPQSVLLRADEVIE